MAFDDIIGHDKPKNLLRGILKHRNIPHAFLFCGQDGIGKKKTAQEMVKYLFCETGTACGSCRPCMKLEKGIHPDLVLIESEESIGIDRSRLLRKEISEHPFESEKRAIIIDNAETLTTEAANALLKTLEEPPPFNHFFLITSAEQEVPLTIRSRCTRVFFPPLTTAQLKTYFLEKLSGGEEQAELIARISYGSIGCGLFWAQDENLETRRMLAQLIAGTKKGFVNASLITERVAKTRNGFQMYLAFLLSLFRDLSVGSCGGGAAMIINRDVADSVSWQDINVSWVEETIKRIQKTMSIMRYNINRLVAFENLLFQVMR